MLRARIIKKSNFCWLVKLMKKWLHEIPFIICGRIDLVISFLSKVEIDIRTIVLAVIYEMQLSIPSSIMHCVCHYAMYLTSEKEDVLHGCHMWSCEVTALSSSSFSRFLSKNKSLGLRAINRSYPYLSSEIVIIIEVEKIFPDSIHVEFSIWGKRKQDVDTLMEWTMRVMIYMEFVY